MPSLAVPAAPQKSTNGRSNIKVDWGRLRFRALSWVAPAIAQTQALERFLAPPPVRPPSRRAKEVWERAKDRFTIAMNTTLGETAETSRLSVAVWGSGPAIYLLHGWGGRSTQWASFVDPLVAAGHTVVAFDAPLHGDSTGTRTSIPHFASALTAVIENVGPAHAVIAHSIGGVATSVALGRGLRTRAVVFIGSPAEPTAFFRTFMTQIGLPAQQGAAIQKKFEKEYGFQWDELVVRAPSHAPNLPALVVHDRDDRDVPFACAGLIAQAWPSATTLETRGLGHLLVMRDEAIIERAVAFASRSGD